MALTPQEIQAYRSQYGVTPKAISMPSSGSASGMDSNQLLSIYSGAPAKKTEETSSGFDVHHNPTSTDPNSLQNRGRNDVLQAGSDIADTMQGNENPLEKGFEATARASSVPLKLASEVLPGSVREGLKKVGEGASAAVNWLGDKIADIPGFKEWVENNPDASQHLETLAKIGGSAGTIAGNILAGEGMVKTGAKIVNKVAPVVPAITDTAKATIKSGIDTGKGAVDKLTGKFGSNPTKTELTGQILQPNKGALESGGMKVGEKTLPTIDTEGVKTFADLEKNAQKAIDANSKGVDAELEKDPTPKKIQSYAKEVTVGDSSIHHNYVLDMLKQLKDYYTSTNDIKNLTKIKGLETKADPIKGAGLTLKEVNDLARQHGRDLNAFNASGELSSGLTKQAAENTRAGVKETVRDLLPDATTRNLDKHTTDLIRTKEMITDMKNRVQVLENKFKKAGLLQKAGNIIGKGIRLVSGGLFEGMVKSITGLGNEAGKALNPIQIQEQLAKNLAKLKEIEGMSPKDAVDEIKKMQTESPEIKEESATH